MSIELKIKSKHLGEESKIIRFEERKLQRQLSWYRARGGNDGQTKVQDNFFSIRNHRRWDVRNENRATFLARAFIDNKPYRSVEAKRKSDGLFRFYIVPRIVDMVNRYGARKITKEEILKWSE
jgi:hypothetical protein